MKRVVVLGGAGVFGARLVRLLAETRAWDIVVAGRDGGKADHLARQYGGIGVALDRQSLSPDALRGLQPIVVVDASGPFEVMGNAPYRVVAAALEAGAHYLDIADGRDFVAGIGTIDRVARAAGRVVLSGASTTPALSSAVCDVLTPQLARVDAIEVGVSPGNRAPRGLAVVRSILSYSGKPVSIWRRGLWETAPGWGLLRRADLSETLRGRWLSLCDAPDLALFPQRYAIRERMIFRGGLELSFLHLGLTTASQLVRLGILPNLSLFAEMARDLADLFIGFGTDRGGMIVEVWGHDADGQALLRRWRLVAEGGDGPNIPILAAFACLEKLDRLTPGARPCMGEVSLTEFDALFQRFRITTQMETFRVD